MEPQEQAATPSTPQKRGRFSWRRFIQAMLTLVLSVTCLSVLMSAARHQGKRMLSGMDIVVLNEEHAAFVDEARVKALASHNGRIDLLHTPMAGLDLRGMEAVMMANPWLETARVYVDNQYTLHIQVKQRIPAIRIFQKDGESYYLDRSLEKLPLSTDYTAYVPVVTNVPALRNDSLGQARREEIGWIVHHLSEHPFWRAQSSQLVMEEDGTYEMVPVVGHQRILLGDTSRMEEKLANLMAFYKQVQNRVGWDKYHTIDVRFAGQVVAAPALKWKAPMNSAPAGLNWVDVIMAEGAKDTLSAASKTPGNLIKTAKPAIAQNPAKPSTTTALNNPKPAPAKARNPQTPKPTPDPKPASPKPNVPPLNP